MKALNKIYLHGYEFDDEPCKSWEREPKVKGMRGYHAIYVEYIRKDALWKPTEEQMNALNFAITYMLSIKANPTVLRDLYDDLLKLK